MTQDFEHSYSKIKKFLDVLENDNRTKNNPLLCRFKPKTEDMVNIFQNNLQELQKVMMINEETFVTNIINDRSNNQLSMISFLIKIVHCIRQVWLEVTNCSNFKTAEMY